MHSTGKYHLIIPLSHLFVFLFSFSSCLHRRSSYVAIFALNPTYLPPTHLSAPPTGSDTSSHSSSLTPMSLPVYHACMADLKFPVESLGSTVISGKDHHSDAEDVEHLELGMC